MFEDTLSFISNISLDKILRKMLNIACLDKMLIKAIIFVTVFSLYQV